MMHTAESNDASINNGLLLESLYMSPPAPRMEVLDVHKLNMSHFGTLSDAMAAADQLIARQREIMPDIEALHPDIMFEVPQLCQFWYAVHHGTEGYTDSPRPRGHRSATAVTKGENALQACAKGVWRVSCIVDEKTMTTKCHTLV